MISQLNLNKIEQRYLNKWILITKYIMLHIGQLVVEHISSLKVRLVWLMLDNLMKMMKIYNVLFALKNFKLRNNLQLLCCVDIYFVNNVVLIGIINKFYREDHHVVLFVRESL